MLFLTYHAHLLTESLNGSLHRESYNVNLEIQLILDLTKLLTLKSNCYEDLFDNSLARKLKHREYLYLEVRSTGVSVHCICSPYCVHSFFYLNIYFEAFCQPFVVIQACSFFRFSASSMRFCKCPSVSRSGLSNQNLKGLI